MDGRQHLEAAIGKHGNVARAAIAWNITPSTLYAVTRGWRGVSRQTAAEWAAKSNGELHADKLVWIRATRKREAA